MDAQLLNSIERVAQKMRAATPFIGIWQNPTVSAGLVENFISCATERSWQDLYTTMKRGNEREQVLATFLFLNIGLHFPGEIPAPLDAYGAVLEVARRGMFGARMHIAEYLTHLDRAFIPRRKLEILRVLMKDSDPEIVKIALRRLGDCGDTMGSNDDPIESKVRDGNRKSNCSEGLETCVEALGGMLRADHPQCAHALKATTRLNHKAQSHKTRLIELLDSKHAGDATLALYYCTPKEEFNLMVTDWLASPDVPVVLRGLSVLAGLRYDPPATVQKALIHAHLMAGTEDIQGLAAMAILMGGGDRFLAVAHAVDQCERIADDVSELSFGKQLMMNWASRLVLPPFEFYVPHIHEPRAEAASHVAMEIVSRFFGGREANVGLLEILPRLKEHAAKTLPLLHQLLETSDGERHSQIRHCMNTLEVFKGFLNRRACRPQ